MDSFLSSITELLTQTGALITAILAALGGTEATHQTRKRVKMPRWGTQVLNGAATFASGAAAAKMTGLSWGEALTATLAGWGAGQVGYKAKKRKAPKF